MPRDLFDMARLARAAAGLWLAFAAAASAQTQATTQAIRIARLSEPGPVTGVVVHVDLRRAQVMVLPTAPLVGTDPSTAPKFQLDTVSAAARLHDLDVALNASFFGTDAKRNHGTRAIAFFAGNLGRPVGWHLSDGRLLAQPVNDKLRATLQINHLGQASIADGVKQLAPDTLHAVSGNFLLLANGQALANSSDARAPRSSVGLSGDGHTLVLMAIDGRSEQSRGASMGELAALMLRHGAADAINLDGGGSTALVVKDHATGVYGLANQPSDPMSALPGARIERPVADVIGVRIPKLN